MASRARDPMMQSRTAAHGGAGMHVDPMELQMPNSGRTGAWQAPPERREQKPPDPIVPVQSQGLGIWAQAFPEWDNLVRAALPRLGVHGSFRPLQREAINACLAGRDVFVRMPTGGGKSLVYQIPAVVKPLVIVISPLVSLIQDQVQELTDIGVGASSVRSRGDESGEDIHQVSKRMVDGDLQIVYVTPEMMHQSAVLQKTLRRLYTEQRLQRFVIDEAHCCSTWGNEFRESYLELRNLRVSFPNVPILACTATATDEIISSVLKQLSMVQDTVVFLSPVDRPNLQFEVRIKNKKSVVREIGELIHSSFSGQSGIIYCLSRQNCEDVQKELAQMQIRAEVYHASVNSTQRAAVQQRWKRGETPIIVATIAFGMGVNKRDVRFVIHHSFPKSLEGYYQEAGRAGRDGRCAACIVFYDYEDKKRHQNLAQGDRNQAVEHTEKTAQRLLGMVGYLEARECRRSLIARYFGGAGELKQVVCGGGPAVCDICKAARSGTTFHHDNVTREAQIAAQFLRAVRSLPAHGGSPITLNTTRDALLGAKHQKLARWQDVPGFGLLGNNGWCDREVLRLLRRLVIESILAEEITTPAGASGNVTVAYLIEGHCINALLQGEIAVYLCRDTKPPQASTSSKRRISRTATNSRKKAAAAKGAARVRSPAVPQPQSASGPVGPAAPPQEVGMNLQQPVWQSPQAPAHQAQFPMQGMQPAFQEQHFMQSPPQQYPQLQQVYQQQSQQPVPQNWQMPQSQGQPHLQAQFPIQQAPPVLQQQFQHAPGPYQQPGVPQFRPQYEQLTSRQGHPHNHQPLHPQLSQPSMAAMQSQYPQAAPPQATHLPPQLHTDMLPPHASQLMPPPGHYGQQALGSMTPTGPCIQQPVLPIWFVVLWMHYSGSMNSKVSPINPTVNPKPIALKLSLKVTGPVGCQGRAQTFGCVL
ncbi:Blm [Symbiodinium sp. CCMP2592]|nr:Blm [Symbiodinium sp. CCMP2592]